MIAGQTLGDEAAGYLKGVLAPAAKQYPKVIVATEVFPWSTSKRKDIHQLLAWPETPPVKGEAVAGPVADLQFRAGISGGSSTAPGGPGRSGR